MSTADWSRSLFSLNKNVPTFLPQIFRLPSGLTRNSNNCFLSEIHEAGYEGPIDQPPNVSEEFHVVWNPKTLSWDVEKTSDNPALQAQLVSDRVYTELRNTLKTFNVDICSDKYSDQYKQRVIEYRGRIVSLLNSHDNHGYLLTFSDIPEVPSNMSYSKKMEQFAYSQWLDKQYDNIKNIYETQGVICANFDLSNFTTPVASGWVVGQGPIDSVTLLLPYKLIPSGYQISTSVAGLSGYYMLVPSGYDDTVNV